MLAAAANAAAVSLSNAAAAASANPTTTARPYATPYSTDSFFPGWAIPNSTSTEKLWAYPGVASEQAGVSGTGGGINRPRMEIGLEATASSSADPVFGENAFGLGTAPGLASTPFGGPGLGNTTRPTSATMATAGTGSAVNPALLSNIVDVIVVHGSDVVPEGYEKVLLSSGGRKADLNTGAMGQYVYIAVKRDVSAFCGSSAAAAAAAAAGKESCAGGGPGGVRGRRVVGGAAVVALALIFPDRGETVPPLFQKVRRQGQPVDLNHGTNGERTFLCYKRGTTNPITDIQVRCWCVV